MKERLKFVIIGAISMGAFVVFSYFVHKNLFYSIDFDTTVRLQDKISRRFDFPFSIFSILGSSEVTVLLIGIVFLTVLIKRRHFFLGIIMFFLMYGFELFGKFFVYHPGPPFMFLRYDLGFLFPSSYVSTKYSYPSGHTARTIFLGILFLYILTNIKSPKIKGILSILIVMFMATMIVSRVYLGEHWSSDVVGGILLGASMSSLAIAFW